MAPHRAVLLDTSFILALENRDDPYRERAKGLDRILLDEMAIFVLHWGILLEIADGYARVKRRSKGLRLIERILSEPGYQMFPLTALLLDEAPGLYRSRTDKDWGLTDCVSFSVMKREMMTEALTADVHFRQAGFRPLLLEP